MLQTEALIKLCFIMFWQNWSNIVCFYLIVKENIILHDWVWSSHVLSDYLISIMIITYQQIWCKVVVIRDATFFICVLRVKELFFILFSNLSFLVISAPHIDQCLLSRHPLSQEVISIRSGNRNHPENEAYDCFWGDEWYFPFIKVSKVVI